MKMKNLAFTLSNHDLQKSNSEIQIEIINLLKNEIDDIECVVSGKNDSRRFTLSSSDFKIDNSKLALALQHNLGGSIRHIGETTLKNDVYQIVDNIKINNTKNITQLQNSIEYILSTELLINQNEAKNFINLNTIKNTLIIQFSGNNNYNKKVLKSIQSKIKEKVSDINNHKQNSNKTTNKI